MNLRYKVLVGYFILIVLIGFMASILVRERHRISEIDLQNSEVQQAMRDIHNVHRYITRLTMLGESVIDWNRTDCSHYRIQRLCTDSLLQALKFHCAAYVYPAQIDTLRSLLASKEEHLRHIMSVFERQEEADSILVNHLPEVAKRATRVRTVQQKKKGIAGFFGGKKTVQVLPSAQELHEFSDSLITLQRKQAVEMDAYADSLRTRNRTLNAQLDGLITELDRRAQEAFMQKERKIAEAQSLSVRLFTATISVAIILLFLSYLTIHRELKRNAGEKKKREKLIGELQESNAKNEELIRLRRNLIQNVSHELRTPLTAISGNAELLLNDDNRDSRMRHAEVIGISAGRMASMLNSLLDYFRLDSRKVTIQSKPFKLSLIADTLETEFMAQVQSKHLTLTIHNYASEVVNGDKNRILSIGGNLLSNAIKFTDSGIITLTTRYKDGVFTLTVEDTGTGISEGQKERIFEPFERLGNAATQDGFGLGLSIVKQLVELMDGSISVESEKEKGSKFTVVLPLPKTEETVADMKKGQVQDIISNYSVIVIDNDLVTLGMIRDMLVQNGIGCDTCLTVEELTDKMRGKDYDLLITDLKMPEVNGYEILELLRTSDIGNSRSIPIVAATAAGFITEEELQSAGFTAMLGKPFSIAELLNVITQYANKEHRQQPDFSALLAFGDRRHTLERLIMETKKEMDELRKAAETKGMEALDGWIHHLRSSWMLMKAEQPLTILYKAIHNENISESKVNAAVDAVLAQGKLIVDLARKEMERWEE
jgi:two-component system sensor histidine kinase EvgS